jgi:hypothetical protein
LIGLSVKLRYFAGDIVYLHFMELGRVGCGNGRRGCGHYLAGWGLRTPYSEGVPHHAPARPLAGRVAEALVCDICVSSLGIVCDSVCDNVAHFPCMVAAGAYPSLST